WNKVFGTIWTNRVHATFRFKHGAGLQKLQRQGSGKRVWATEKQWRRSMVNSNRIVGMCRNLLIFVFILLEMGPIGCRRGGNPITPLTSNHKQFVSQDGLFAVSYLDGDVAIFKSSSSKEETETLKPVFDIVTARHGPPASYLWETGETVTS